MKLFGHTMPHYSTNNLQRTKKKKRQVGQHFKSFGLNHKIWISQLLSVSISFFGIFSLAITLRKPIEAPSKLRESPSLANKHVIQLRLNMRSPNDSDSLTEAQWIEAFDDFAIVDAEVMLFPQTGFKSSLRNADRGYWPNDKVAVERLDVAHFKIAKMR